MTWWKRVPWYQRKPSHETYERAFYDLWNYVGTRAHELYPTEYEPVFDVCLHPPEAMIDMMVEEIRWWRGYKDERSTDDLA